VADPTQQGLHHFDYHADQARAVAGETARVTFEELRRGEQWEGLHAVGDLVTHSDHGLTGSHDRMGVSESMPKTASDTTAAFSPSRHPGEKSRHPRLPAQRCIVGRTLFDVWRPSAPYILTGCLSGLLCLMAVYVWGRGALGLPRPSDQSGFPANQREMRRADRPTVGHPSVPSAVGNRTMTLARTRGYNSHMKKASISELKDKLSA